MRIKRKWTACGAGCLVLLFGSCWGRPEEHITRIENGPFTILIRSQEFHHSASLNMDVCVTQTPSRKFPSRESCFLRGYDFNGLSAKWRSNRVIEISFGCGRVTYFKNDALVYPSGPVPEEFHAILREDCGYTESKTCEASTQTPLPSPDAVIEHLPNRDSGRQITR